MSALSSEFLQKLQGITEDARARLSTAIDSLLDRIHQRAVDSAPEDKGKLVRSLREAMWNGPSNVGGEVASGYYIARFWERGWGGHPVDVHGFTRRVRSRSVSARLDGKRKRKIAQGIAFVKPFTREVKFQQRPFLVPALDSMRSEIRSTLERAIHG